MSFDCALCTLRLTYFISDLSIHFSRVITSKLAFFWSAFPSFSGSALQRVYYANTNSSAGTANSVRRAGCGWSGRNRSYNNHRRSYCSLWYVLQGSGKTLAYGLPILHHIISHPRPPRTKRKLQALVLAPTRELALQVSDHLNIFARIIDVNKEAQDVDVRNTNGKEKQPETKTQNAPPLVSIAAVVGGMSAQKQRRILDRGVDVLVATPGRLWDILGEARDPYFKCLIMFNIVSSRMSHSRNKSAS